ncbi:MAG: FliM/FliN family flagellar motor switch protein [Lysobacteraceae bacterium]
MNDVAGPGPIQQPPATRLRRIDPVLASLARRLFAGPLVFRGPEGATMHCHALAGLAAEEAVELQIDGLPILLGARVTGASPGAEMHWSDLLGRARLLAWSLAHEPLVVALQSAFGGCVLPLRMVPMTDPAAIPRDLWLQWRLDAPATGYAAAGWMALPAQTAQLLAPNADSGPRHRSGPVSALPASVALALARVRMPVPLARSLMPGSVVVLGQRDAVLAAASATCRPGDGACAWRRPVRIGGGQVHLHAGPPPEAITIHPQGTEEEGMTQDRDDGAGAGDGGTAPATGAPLMVELAFELGRQPLSLGEADALQPGYVFELPVPAEGATVTIRSHGHPVGRGELVVVGEVIGVRVVQWGGDGL